MIKLSEKNRSGRELPHLDRLTFPLQFSHKPFTASLRRQFRIETAGVILYILFQSVHGLFLKVSASFRLALMYVLLTVTSFIPVICEIS